MRRTLVLLATAGAIAALFATAARGPSTVGVSTTFHSGFVILTNLNGCSFAERGVPLPGPVIVDCRTHGEAERLQARVQRGLPVSAAVSVRGSRVVFP